MQGNDSWYRQEHSSRGSQGDLRQAERCAGPWACGALCKASFEYEPFAVLLPDVLVLDKESRGKNVSFAQLVNAWNDTGIGQVMVEPVASERVESYGIADLGDETTEPFKSVKLRGLVEKPSPGDAPSNLAVLGRYVLPSSVLDLLENTGVGVGGEIQLTDALHALLKSEGLNAFETDAATFDCGNKQGFLGANVAVGMQDPKIKAYLKALIDSSDA